MQTKFNHLRDANKAAHQYGMRVTDCKDPEFKYEIVKDPNMPELDYTKPIKGNVFVVHDPKNNITYYTCTDRPHVAMARHRLVRSLMLKMGLPVLDFYEYKIRQIQYRVKNVDRTCKVLIEKSRAYGQINYAGDVIELECVRPNQVKEGFKHVQ